jgi:hypothetical protein
MLHRSRFNNDRAKVIREHPTLTSSKISADLVLRLQRVVAKNATYKKLTVFSVPMSKSYLYMRLKVKLMSICQIVQ